MTVDNIQEVIDRAIEFCNVKSEAELAREMGTSEQNLNQKKKRGTAVKSIVKFCEKKGANPEWIKTGKGSRNKPTDTKGGDDSLEGWKRAYERQEELLAIYKQRVATLEAELLRLRTGEGDRRNRVQA